MVDLVNAYEKQRPKYIDFTERIVHLLKELLNNDDIIIHNIEGRAKETKSFRKKIIRKTNKYTNPLNEITDLSGIRVITYYQDDVDIVERLIKKEFIVDKKNSLDKGELLKTNEFGYRSVHYILSLSEERLKLPEWSKYREFKFEVQIRTVLQHAWASISHSIQYKHEEDVPGDLKRKLFRLAGIFELADEEFMDVRKKNSVIMKEIKSTSKEEVMDFELNLLTISEYIFNSPNVRSLLENAEKEGFNYEYYEAFDDEDESDSSSQLLRLCKDFGIETVRDLDSVIKNNLAESQAIYRNIIIGHGEWEISPSFAVILILVHIYRGFIKTQTLVELGWSESIAEMVIEQLGNYGK
ncbi:GTP pyrophosphokinase [Psychrobacillus sp. FSL K6-1415]|uniref:GTP pyrophosphokinase n=1 Tax=Psychrobacillus sp. FSL K6-1415 TaxID=2921544 RepID=UPI0030FC33ED